MYKIWEVPPIMRKPNAMEEILDSILLSFQYLAIMRQRRIKLAKIRKWDIILIIAYFWKKVRLKGTIQIITKTSLTLLSFSVRSTLKKLFKNKKIDKLVIEVNQMCATWLNSGKFGYKTWNAKPDVEKVIKVKQII